ncbi:hypothetical protein MNBD_CHLOROFLEXI01-4751 [hydrothermal vent metagenome]|uniref:Uncharacterized protein n=1 Tax=hydrothermal vent metagenome TaxID=652676 RepID=A0A3B0WEL5_9ZZZZ
MILNLYQGSSKFQVTNRLTVNLTQNHKGRYSLAILREVNFFYDRLFVGL